MAYRHGVSRWAALAVAACASLATASAASADTLGQASVGNLGCNSPALWGDSSAGYAAPGPGHISSFSYDSTGLDDGQTVDFLALRPTGTPGHFTVIGRSGAQTLQGDIGGTVQTFPLATPLLVNAQDTIAQFGSAFGCGTFINSGGDMFVGNGSSDPSVGDDVGTQPFAIGTQLNEAADYTPSIPLVASSQTGVTGPVLASGKTYKVVVRGTYSPYISGLMSGTVKGWKVCGTPEAAPQYGSGGPVGQDAQFVFARPQANRCDPSFKFPHRYEGILHPILFDLSGAGRFGVLTPDSNAYNPAHTYTYTVTGQGHALDAVLLDTHRQDNYGTFEIDVWPTS